MRVPEDQQRAKADALGIPFWIEDPIYKILEKQGTLSLRQWAWQFFRRNRDYRIFYRERMLPYFEESSDDIPLGELKRRFGVMLADDPRKRELEEVGMTVATVTEYRPAPKGMISEFQKDRCQKLYVVDFRRSIDDQLASIRRDAKAYKAFIAKDLADYAKERRQVCECYPKYLRVLDAIDVGATPAEIAKVMLPNNDPSGARQNVQDWKKAANELREKQGYIDLFLAGSGGTFTKSKGRKK